MAVYLSTGLIGNIVYWVVATLRHSDALLIGASGCVMGIVGALLYEALVDWRAGVSSAERLRLIVMQIALQCCFDFAHPQVASSAHPGGMVSGFLLGACSRCVAPVRNHQ